MSGNEFPGIQQIPNLTLNIVGYACLVPSEHSKLSGRIQSALHGAGARACEEAIKCYLSSSSL